MLSVGSPRELKTTPRVSLSRSRLKKGKALAKRKTIQEVMIEQDERGTRLPNIRTSQLVGLSKIGNAGSELAKSSRTEKVKYLRPRRMSVPTFRDESFDIVDADNLDGLIISSLECKNQEHNSSAKDCGILSSSGSRFKEAKRLSLSNTGTDSGFGEESSESMGDYKFGPEFSSMEVVDTVSSHTNEALDIRQLQMKNSSQVKARRPVIVRSFDKIDSNAPMCTQSLFSLHDDLMALKNLALHERAQRLKSTDLAERAAMPPTLSPSSSASSLIALKKKPKLFSRRSSGVESFSAEGNSDFFSNVNTRTSVPNKYFGLRGNSSNEEEKFVRFDVQNSTSDCGFGNQSVSNLTEKSLSETNKEQSVTDAHSKCEEWLSRWLATTSSYQTTQTDDSIDLDSIEE